MIVYLQVAIISQALIFITRAHSFFFMERPSFALMAAFVVAQMVSSIIAAYGNWGFTRVHAISGGWIGIIWIWVRPAHAHSLFILNMLSAEHHLVHPSRLDQIRHECHRHQASPQPSPGESQAGRRSRWTHRRRPARAYSIQSCLYQRIAIPKPHQLLDEDDEEGRIWPQGQGQARGDDEV